MPLRQYFGIAQHDLLHHFLQGQMCCSERAAGLHRKHGHDKFFSSLEGLHQ
jgi:hypothetical protein